MHIEEMVVVLDVRRQTDAMVEASKSYEKSMSLAVKFLIAKNDWMVKDLQEARQRTR